MVYGNGAVTLYAGTHLDRADQWDGTVMSNSIFGTRHRTHSSDRMIYEDKYTRVGYIDLAKKVLNPFLAGKKAPVWQRILGIKQEQMVNILNARLVWDNDIEGENKFVNRTEVDKEFFDPERFIFGADLLLKLLDEVDIEKLLHVKLFETFVLPHLTDEERSAYADDDTCIGEIVGMGKEFMNEDDFNIHTDGWLFNDYFIDLSAGSYWKMADEMGNMTNYNVDYRMKDADGNTIVKHTNRMDMLYYEIGKHASEGIVKLQQFPIINLLMSMIGQEMEEKTIDKSILKSQVLDYVFVLPKGYRPTINGRVDMITSQYNRLVSANTDLKDLLLQGKNIRLRDILNKYEEVSMYIRNIFVGDDKAIKSQRLKNYKSISDSITGKEGLMRGRMQGVRVDYSARTVITCDPFMPIDCIGVPKSILYKVSEPCIIRDAKKGGTESAKIAKSKNLARISTVKNKDANQADILDYDKLFEDWYKNHKDAVGIIGRQPTLFFLGMQGFKIIPVDGDSIVLSPLIVMPFNADFDGDQMHFNMPTTEAGIKDVKENMMFENNMRYPKNGEHTVVMRHEIIYGLWMCSTVTEHDGSRNVNIKDLADVYSKVCKQEINIYDKVSVSLSEGNMTQSAGVAALEYAIYGANASNIMTDENIQKKGLKAKDVTALLSKCYGAPGGDNNARYMAAINRLVKLGFSVAKIWPPNITTITDEHIRKEVDKMIEVFNREVLEREEYVNMGIEIESEYTNYFNKRWKQLQDDIYNYLIANFDETDNGYITMMKSGSKGDKNNIMQVFGLKGRVQKNDTTAFNSIIAGSYAGHLTGIEGFISAYGSRKGIADKTLATAEPGYMSRKLEHTGSIVRIVADDCHTKNGMEFRLEDIVPFIDESQISSKGTRLPESEEERKEFISTDEFKVQLNQSAIYLSKIIKGRYCVDSNGSSVFIENEGKATEFILKCWGEDGSGKVVLRSPVYCDKPCCKRCYGIDLTKGELPKMGRYIGFIAAQAIGEPGTQLTMKNFQKGGVVTEANLTSSFSLIEDYFELHNFAGRKSKNGVLTYDMISPFDGTIKEQYLGNGTKRITIVPDYPDDEIVKKRKRSLNNKRIIVYAGTKLKDHVYEGESLQKIQGNLNMREVLTYRGFDKAVSYLTLMLYNTFMTQDVNFKHFEAIVSAQAVCYLHTDVTHSHKYGKDESMNQYNAGSVVTWSELKNSIEPMAGGNSLHYTRTILGLKELPKFRSDFFESLLMESMDSYVPRALIMNPNDSMVNPITRAAFGLKIDGSDRKKK